MSGLSKVGAALSVVFVVSLLALVAELLYVLWRRRLLRRQTPTADGGAGQELGSDSFPTASKELLYFLCWKQSQSRVEPDGGGGGGGANPATDDNVSSPEEVIDLLKLHAMYGPSRVLFTIKEEEREEVDSEKSLSLSGYSAEKEAVKETRRVTLGECLSVAEESPEITVIVVGDGETTPYSTPYDSPLYFTPSASPIREFA